jgi:Polysaccharide deacetylase
MSLAQEFSGLLVNLLSGAYPAFVTRGRLGSEIPVFLYHRIDHAQFEGHLQHLNKNGYVSLSADEHFAALTGARPCPERSVVLTFDDGLSDFYERAFPLLQKYEVKAVAFIIPARVDASGMVTWAQIQEMHQSGLVDIQSHSHHHAAIPISPKVIDFYHPKYHVFQPWDVPVSEEWEAGVPRALPALGTPILESYSRLGDHRRYFSNPRYREACAAFVQSAGNAKFFDRLGWRRILRHSTADASRSAKQGRYETPAEQRAAIECELVESKAFIERRLSGKHVRHLAYPWNQMGEITKGVLRECGYVSGYAGMTRYKGPVLKGNGLYEIARISGDFVPCLPGEGRKSLLKVFARKLTRRLLSGRPY